MTTDLEIRITSKNLSDAGIDAASRKVKSLKNDFKDVEAASNIDSKINVDDSELDAADRTLADLNARKVQPQISPDTTEVAGSVDEVQDQFAAIDLSDMGSSIMGQMSGLLGAGGPIAGVVAAGAAVFGDDLAAGFTRGFSANKRGLELEIRTGLSQIDLEPIGAAAGEAYSKGLGDSLSDVRDTALLLKAELGSVDDDLDLSEATRQAQVMSDVIGIDLAQSINLARRLVSNDLVNDTDEAFNLMVDTAQRFQLNFDEIFEVASEFAPVFKKLGVDGAQAFNIIGETVRQGLLPNVDRAAELFEEFNIRVTDNSAEEAIDGIGLSMAEVRSQVSQGLGDEALADVASALLDIEDAAVRDEKAIEIFGAAIESAADPEAVLTLLATADATREVGQAADEAVTAAEGMQTGLDKAQRSAENLGVGLAGIVNRELDVVFAIDSFAKGLVGLGDEADETTKSVGLMSAGFGAGMSHVRDLDGAMANATDGTEELGDGFEDLAAAEAAAAAEAEDLENSLRGLSDWADQSGEAALRNIWSATNDLTEAFGENTAAAFDVADGWDLTSEAGRNGSQTVSDLRGDVARLTEEFLDGQIGPSQYRDALSGLEAGIDAAGREAGLSTAEIAVLKAEILGLPAETRVRVNAETDAAFSATGRLAARLNSLDGKTANTFVNNNVTTNYRTNTYTPVQRQSGARAHGGVVGNDGGLTLVGEDGPELVGLAAGSSVITAPDTDRRLSQGGGGGVGRGGGGAGMSIVINVAGSVLSERDLIAVVRDELVTGGLADAFTGTGL